MMALNGYFCLTRLSKRLKCDYIKRLSLFLKIMTTERNCAYETLGGEVSQI
jgi:hypothetical protein